MNLRRQFDGLFGLQVADSRRQHLNTLPAITDEVIAGAAQQPANFASGMAVVDVKSSPTTVSGGIRRETADTALAALGFEHSVVFGESDAVLGSEVCIPMARFSIGLRCGLDGFLTRERSELNFRSVSRSVLGAARLVFEKLAGTEFFLAVRAWAKNPTAWATMLWYSFGKWISQSVSGSPRFVAAPACCISSSLPATVAVGEISIRLDFLAGRTRQGARLNRRHRSAVSVEMPLQHAVLNALSAVVAYDRPVGFVFV